jgi:hypothetical protein
MSDAVTSTAHLVPAEELYALADRLGVTKRTFEEWRHRGLIEHPTRVGFDGKRPLWAYPAEAPKQLREIVRLRRQTPHLDAILIMLWARDLTASVDDVRAALLSILDRFEQTLLRDIAKVGAPGATVDDLRDHPDAMRLALERYADEVARRRTRSPDKHRVRMTLAERQRGWFYMLAPFFDQQRDDADALHAERVLGIARGRSGTAGGLPELTPNEHLATRSLTPAALRPAITAADDTTYIFVATALNSFLTLTPLLMPILLPATSTLRTVSEETVDLIRNPPPEFIALLAAVIVRNTHERRAHHELTPDLIQSLERSTLWAQIIPALTLEQRKQLTGVMSEK